MSLDAHQAAALIVSHVGQAHATSGHPPVSSANVGTTFCTIWPEAKPVITLLATLAAWIPGVGTTTGGVLTGLIAVGDQISSQVCPHPGPTPTPHP